ncbi:MAG: CHAT domain-containing protein [Theionarchaea archaeon]|nr:CHAT domain-containing protein [Theionarchaea archaeon]
MKDQKRTQMKWKFFIIALLYASLLPIAGSSQWSYTIDGITAFSQSDSGNFVAVGCEDGYYYIFDSYGNNTGHGKVPEAVKSLDIADTGELLVGSDAGYTFCTKEGYQSSGCRSYPVRTVSLSSDGTFSLVCSMLNLYINIDTSIVQQLEITGSFPFGVVSSDGSLACAASGSTLFISRGEGFQDYALDEEVKHLFISNDGKRVIFSNKKIGYFETEKEKIYTRDLGSPIEAVAVTPAGDIILVSTKSHLIWLENQSIIKEIPHDNISSISLSEDGSLAAVGGDNTVQVITMDGEVLATYTFESPLLVSSLCTDHLTVCTDKSIHRYYFHKKKTNTRFYEIPSRKSLPLTSPFEEVWSLPVKQKAFIFTGDRNGDGINDIMLVEGSTMSLLDEKGTRKLTRELSRAFSQVKSLDFDGDTLEEFSVRFSATEFTFSVYDFMDESTRDYKFISEVSTPPYKGSVIPFAVLDCDNDGNSEILASIWVSFYCYPRGVIALDCGTGDVEWFYQMGAGLWPYVVEDINGDGVTEIVMGSVAACNCGEDQFPDCDARVVALSITGEELWIVSQGYGYRRVAACVDDINDEEGLEVIGFGYEASENWGSLFVLNCSGEYLYKSEVDYSIYPGAVGDIDGDGSKEIVAADYRGYLSVFTGDLELKSEKFIGGIDSQVRILLNDINGDGFCEILLGTEKELFILDKGLNITWKREFPDKITFDVTNFSCCKNTVLVLSDKLYSFSYDEREEPPCPLWAITERKLSEEGTNYLEKAESLFLVKDYRGSRSMFENALTIFEDLEDQEKKTSVSAKITELSEIIFKLNVRMGLIILGACDILLPILLVYYWITRKKWYRLLESTFLLSLPILLGLLQVYYANEEYVFEFLKYFVFSSIFSVGVLLRQNILGFIKTIQAVMAGHKNMLVLSIVKADGSYKISVEGIEERFKPVKESREVIFPEEMKRKLIKKAEFLTGIISQCSSSKTQKMSISYGEGVLRDVGKVIYQNFIPEDFSDFLKQKFLFLEVEDPDIPWELMYDDDFFAVKYAISRRIVTTEKVNIRHKRTRGRRALIISDPLLNLPGAQVERDIVYGRLRQNMETILVEGNDANTKKVANLLGQGFDIIHFAGHVEKGILMLSDGVMTPQEVKEFMAGTPIVVVNGCKSEDLAKAFVLGGAMAYVGTIHPIHDGSAADIAADFYDFCLQYRIGEALRRARELHISKDLVWASLVMYGDPTLKLL